MSLKFCVFLLVASIALSQMGSTSAFNPNKSIKCNEPNQVFTPCGSACVDRCGVPKAAFCTEQCIVGCQCKAGYYRNSKNDCVLPKDC